MKMFIKILMLIAICILPLFGLQAQCDAPVTTFPFEESFDSTSGSMPDCWTQEQESGAKDWTLVTSTHSSNGGGSAHSASYMVQFPSTSGSPVTKLITPKLDLSGLGSPTLNFWHAQGDYSGDVDELKVYYKTSEEAAWQLLPTATYTGEISTWTHRSITLPNPSAEYYIAFEAISNFGRGVVLDDISIIDLAGYIDMEVTQITTPTAGTYNNLTSSEVVTVSLKNRSVDPISNFGLRLQVNEATKDSISWEDKGKNAIAVDETVTYTFDNVDFSASGEHNINITVFADNDQVVSNNSKSVTIKNVVCNTITTFPLTESFDDATFPPDCWLNVSEDGAPWKQQTGNGSSPSCSPHSGTGMIYFNSTSGSYNGKTGLIITPELNVQDKNLKLSFWIYRDDQYSGADLLKVYLNDAPNLTNANLLKTINRKFSLDPVETTSKWYEYEVVLPVESMTTTYVIFEGVGDNGNNIHIDDITISEMFDTDVEVLAITAPVSGNDMSNEESVSITLKNNGANPIASLSLKLEKGGSEIATETWSSDPIASGATETYTFTAKADLSAAGEHEITVTAILASDGNSSNDSKTITVTNTVCNVTEYPFNEGFESNGTNRPVCWTQETQYPSTATNWEIVGASTGNNEMPATVHQGTYKARMYGTWGSRGNKTKLVSPKLDLSSLTTPALNFWHTQRKNSSDQDTLRIYYKTSAAGDWILLEEYKTEIFDWTERNIPLPNKSDDYYLAFEGTVYAGKGMQLDDIKVYEFSGYVDMEVAEIISPKAGTFINLTNSEEVKVSLKNNGADPLADFGLRLQVNGVTEDSISWDAAAINAGAIAEYTFEGVNFSNEGNHEILVTVFANTDQVAGNNSKSLTLENTVCETISVLSESFDGELFPPRCWQSKAGSDADTTVWRRVGNYQSQNPYCNPHTGLGQALFNSWSTAYRNKTGLLITPQIDLDPENTNLKLSFWMYRGGSSNNNEKVNVYLNDTPDTVSAILLTTIHRQISLAPVVAADNWYEYSALLSASAPEMNTGYVIFEGVSEGGSNIFLDDITIIDFQNYVEAELVSIDAPAAGEHKDLSANETVTVSIKNNGSDPLANFGLRLQVNGETRDSVTWTSEAIAYGTTNQYSFTTDLSAAGEYTLNVTIFANEDQVPANDSKSVTLSNMICVVKVTPAQPFEYGFEDPEGGSASVLSSCWDNAAITGSAKWSVGNSWSTPHTGDNHAYFYVYKTSPYPSTRLTSPKLDLSEVNNPLFKFWYKQGYNSSSGGPTDTLKVYYKNSKGGEWLHLATYNTVTADWQEAKLILPAKSDDYYISFVSVALGNYNLLDDISISEFSNFTDGEITQIIEPTTSNLINTSQVKVLIKNNGSDPLSNFTLKLYLDGDSITTETYAGEPIASLDEVEYTLQSKLELSDAEYQLSVKLLVPGDQVAENDSQSVTFTNKVCQPINMEVLWSESFEGETFPPSDCWQSLSAGTGTAAGTKFWEKVTTGGNPTCSPISGTNMLRYNSYNITAGATGLLITPPFNLEHRQNVKISFRMYRDDRYPDKADRVNVYVNNKSGIAGATPLITVNVPPNLSPEEIGNGWYEYSATLPTVEGTQAYFILEAVSEYGDNIFVDSITVTAEPAEYTITASADANGTIDPSGEVKVEYGSDKAFTISPNANYKISQVLIDGENDVAAVESGSYEFTDVAANHTIEAVFALQTYNITFDANGGEGTMPAQEFEHGVAKALSANLFTNTDKFFGGWATTASGEVEYADGAQYTATADDTLYAVWDDTPPVVDTITLLASPVEGGQVLGGGNYNENSEITILAVPNIGYNFVSWTEADTVVTTDTFYTFTVTQNRTFVANFALKTYTITFDANGGEGTMPAQEFEHGVAEALSANEFTFERKYFTGWATTASGEIEYADGAQYTATADGTLYAIWADTVFYTVTLSALPVEGGIVLGDGEYVKGSEIAVKAIANPEYIFLYWTESGFEVSYDSVYTFTAIANRNLVANFRKETVSVSVAPAVADVAIYPNPSKGVVNVRVAEKSLIRVFDLSGKLLGVHDAVAGSELKLQLKSGVYFINVAGSIKMVAYKVIVQ